MVRQYQWVADPVALRAYDLPLAAGRDAIMAANQEAGGSVLEMAEAEYMVRASGYIRGVEDLRDVPLKASLGGVPVLLKDVARIRIGPELRRGVSELDGEGEAVGAVIVMRSGANARATIAAAETKLDELRRNPPAGDRTSTRLNSSH